MRPGFGGSGFEARAAALGAALGVDALVDRAGGELRVLVAELRRRPPSEPAGERAVVADLALARWLDAHTGSIAEVARVVELTLARALPRRAGALPPDELAAAAHFTSALRRCLGRWLATGRLHALGELPPAAQLALSYAWDHLLLNPLGPLALCGGGGGGDGDGDGDGEPPRAPADLAGHLVASMWRPLAPPAELDGLALWRDGDAPPLARMLVSLWLINLPAHEVSAPDVDRVVRHVVALCAGMRAHPPPRPLLFGFSHALMTALFRTAYGAGDPTPALAAGGDLIAEMMQRAFPAYAAAPPRRPITGRPRIGYVSTHFRAHAVGHYMASRIVHRDRARFHVTSFALGPRRDAITEQIAAASDAHVHLPRALDYGAVAAAIAGAGLDLLIFADLGMDLPTYLLAGLHLAPRQIVLMGHAASSGLPTVSHYLSGDHEPPDAQRCYRERLVRLPDLGAAQWPPPPPGAVTRAELGVPDDAVLLVSCANAIKHGAGRDDLLAEILARAPGAYLVLKPFFSPAEVDPRITARIHAAAARRGVADRLVVVPPFARAADVLGLYALADVQLDTFPFGGWTTNLEALHAGVPIVTQEGAHGRSRWGACFLRRLGIEAGIAADERGYVEWVVRLAGDAALRGELRARLAGARELLFADGRTQPAYEDALQAILDEP